MLFKGDYIIMCNKKGIKRILMVGAAALMLVGAVVASPKISSKACVRQYLGPFNSRVMITEPACDYTGQEVKPEYKVYYKAKELKEGTDFVATFKNNIEPGTATLTVKGIGAYRGKKKAKFIINEKPVEEVNNLTKIDFQGEEFFAIAAISRFLIEPMANDYLINPSAITNVDAGMGEAFMLFPKTDKVKFRVETVALCEDGTLGAQDVLAQDVTGAVVIYSNPIEYVPNFQVVAECEGKTVTLPISYSGIDGRLVIDSEYVKDVTP
jgi:hypothetical protein